MSSLYVGKLSSHVRHRELETAFRRYGRCNLELKDGFGFVIFEEHRDAENALKALQGRSVCGERPSISWAKNSRPFQRNFGKATFTRKESWDTYQIQGTRRQRSLDRHKRSDDGRREDKLVDGVKDGSRDDAAQSVGREEEWKDSGHEKIVREEELKNVDPLDIGRWDPRMEDSPENMMADGAVEDGEHPSGDKDKEDERGSVHERSQGSPIENYLERSSRRHGNSSDHYRRGVQRSQERCYNCGQSGHVKWQCRSRPRQINMHSRDGGYDGWRNEPRYFGVRGGFRGAGGSRFRGMNGSRRIFNRDIEGSYARRSSRRHEMSGERRPYDPVDGKSREKSKRRRHRSESPKDSSSRGKSKRKHKKMSKKSLSSGRKRKRLSSVSPAPSKSALQSSSSTSSGSQSHSRSGSRSHSGASGSHSSKSGSQSSSSISHSQSSRSQSSRSQSASSLSRSCSASSHSRKSLSRSRSQSLASQSQGQSLSPGSHDISTASPEGFKTNLPLHSDSQQRARSSKHEEDEVATSALQGKEVSERHVDDNSRKGNDSESSERDQHELQRRERRRLWAREVKKHKNDNQSDNEEFRSGGEIQSNGGKRSLVQQDAGGNESLSRGSSGRMDLKRSEPIAHIQMLDMKVYSRTAGGHDNGQDLARASFGAARFWPWEAMLQRRCKRGPISVANYERRKVQNEEFGIVDTFVRSSSGWWEKHNE